MTEAELKLAVLRSEALWNYYSAERRSGVDVMTAHERMAEFAKRFDALQQDNVSEAELDRQLNQIASVALREF